MVKKRCLNFDKSFFWTDVSLSMHLFDTLITLKHLQNASEHVFVLGETETEWYEKCVCCIYNNLMLKYK